MKYISVAWLILVFLWSGCKELPVPKEASQSKKLAIPPNNKIYLAAFPDFGGTEDIVTKERLSDFENLVDKPLAWAYFSNNWTDEKDGIHFPKDEVNTIKNHGRIPFVRMMARQNFDQYVRCPKYTMDNFLLGYYDEDLKQWAKDAKAYGAPLLVEFGTEANGSWFPWNAKWNSLPTKNEYGDPDLYDGMEKFRDVYRRIIDICNQEGADNITWFYHVDAYSDPVENWNNMTGYYPGDEYIDWIGVSVYGPQETSEGWWSFQDVLDDSWEEIASISNEKPIAILEWGVIEKGNPNKKANWIKNAIKTVVSGGKYFPKIKAMSYWHENFDQTLLRIDSSPKALKAYKNGIQNDDFISELIFE